MLLVSCRFSITTLSKIVADREEYEQGLRRTVAKQRLCSGGKEVHIIVASVNCVQEIFRMGKIIMHSLLCKKVLKMIEF